MLLCSTVCCKIVPNLGFNKVWRQKMIINILIVIAVIVMMSVLLSVASDKSGIPMLLFFIVFGMVIGETMPIMPTNAFEIANKVCSIALIFIMFYGGFGTSWRAAKPVAGKALILASFGVFLTAAITGIFVHFVIGFPPVSYTHLDVYKRQIPRRAAWRRKAHPAVQ